MYHLFVFSHYRKYAFSEQYYVQYQIQEKQKHVNSGWGDILLYLLPSLVVVVIVDNK